MTNQNRIATRIAVVTSKTILFRQAPFARQFGMIMNRNKRNAETRCAEIRHAITAETVLWGRYWWHRRW